MVSPSTSIDWLPDAIANTVWPGVWPGAAIDVMPGATSLPGSNFTTLSSIPLKTRRTLSQAGRAPSGALLMLRVVHPERPFGRRHLDLGIRENDRAFLVAQPVDVVRMEVRDQDRVDLLGIDAGGGEIRAERIRGRRELAAGRGVDQDRASMPVFTTSVVNGICSLPGAA